MIVNRQRRVRVKQDELQEFSRALNEQLRLDEEDYVVALVSDARIMGLNRRFRGHAQPTDVLSFPADASAGNGYRGDVAISVETARRNARRCRHPLGEELKLLVLHGLLHLLGYDHETDRGEMNRREHALRRRLGLE